jgi:hypothetical protein
MYAVHHSVSACLRYVDLCHLMVNFQPGRGSDHARRQNAVRHERRTSFTRGVTTWAVMMSDPSLHPAEPVHGLPNGRSCRQGSLLHMRVSTVNATDTGPWVDLAQQAQGARVVLGSIPGQAAQCCGAATKFHQTWAQRHTQIDNLNLGGSALWGEGGGGGASPRAKRVVVGTPACERHW